MEIKEVSGLDLIFGKIDGLLPEKEEIPKEFYRMNNMWNLLVSKWFFEGLTGYTFIPKKGIDSNKAIQHVSAILKSFEPSHEHKIAGCAYLLSEFYEEIKIS